jgi:hypothetical protein
MRAGVIFSAHKPKKATNWKAQDTTGILGEEIGGIMPSFKSFDGEDGNGVRAQVAVETGTGTVLDIKTKGDPARNAKVIFKPDNPKLEFEVFGWLDTSQIELWDLVQAAHTDKRTISYRIESQRRSGVDRATPFDELKHRDDVVRKIAAINDIFSGEALTDPNEDPGQSGVSRIKQNQQPTKPTPPTEAHPAPNYSDALTQARTADAPAEVLTVLEWLAYAQGGPLPTTHTHKPTFQDAAITHAVQAEQFSLDHLVAIYARNATGEHPIEVVDDIISQAASVALEVLKVADRAHTQWQPNAHRTDATFPLALNLTLDSIDKRHPFPVGDTDDAVNDWRTAVSAEAAERLGGITHVAYGEHPAQHVDTEPTAETTHPAQPDETGTTDTADESPAADTAVNAEAMTPEDVADFLNNDTSSAGFTPRSPRLASNDKDWQAPTSEQYEAFRAFLEPIGQQLGYKPVTQWLEQLTGEQKVKSIHGPVLGELLDYIHQAGTEAISAQIVKASNAPF